MAHAEPVGPMTVDEYFDFEERSPIRHEYVDGEVYAMSGATRRHSAIAGNIFVRLRTGARADQCRVHMSEVKLHLGRVIYCPDVMVACGPEPADERIEDAPCLVVEVLSPSTERIDRHEKLSNYKTLSSLGTYLIVAQEERRVDRHWRDTSGHWRHEVFADRGVVPLPCDLAGVDSITVDEIYERVTMPTPAQRLRLREEEALYTEG
jgi:Uma2 family endonuclease